MSVDNNLCWHFASIKGGRDKGPKDAAFEYFNGAYDSLVRESLQNSIDAADGSGEPVVVTYRFRRISNDNFENFYTGLRMHIKGCLDKWNDDDGKERFEPMLKYIDQCKKNNSGMPYLEISDENTTGMDYHEGEDRGGFYAFLKAVGAGAKKTKRAGGAFGFGKSAYFNISAINTLLVSTKTADSGKMYFEGVTSLATHVIDGVKYVEAGYFCKNGDDEEKPISDNIPSRFMREKTGTSISIMGLSQDLTTSEIKDEILKSVLKNFWLAIYEKRLMVNIMLNENNVFSICADNLDGLMCEYFEDVKDSGRGTSSPRPYYEAVKNTPDNKHYYYIKKEIPDYGQIRMYVMKSQDTNDKTILLRDTRMLIKHRPGSTKYGYYSTFIFDGDKGNEVLRSMENATHDEWEIKNCKTKEKKEEGKKLNKIIDSLIDEEIKNIFASHAGARMDIIGSNHYLYIPTTDEDDEDFGNRNTQGKSTGERVDEGSSPTTNASIQIEKKNKKEIDGKVFVSVQTNVTSSNAGKYRSSNSGSKKQNNGGKQTPGNLDNSYKENPNGNNAVVAKPVSVDYHTFAQEENGKMYHYIVINSQVAIDKCKVSMYYVGESSKAKIKVESAEIVADNQRLKCDANVISGITLNANEDVKVKVAFADDIKHRLRLESYEDK